MLILDEPRLVSPSVNNPVLAASAVGSYFFPSTTTSALPSRMRLRFPCNGTSISNIRSGPTGVALPPPQKSSKIVC